MFLESFYYMNTNYYNQSNYYKLTLRAYTWCDQTRGRKSDGTFKQISLETFSKNIPTLYTSPDENR